MNIRDATLLVLAYERDNPGKGGAFIGNRARSDDFRLYVAPGSVYRHAEPSRSAGNQYDMDARDCISDDWFVVNADGEDVDGPPA